MIEAILFDLDGVLVDAADWHYDALNAALAANGYSAITREDHEYHFNGKPTRVKLDMLGIPEEDREKIAEAKQMRTIDIIGERCRPDEEKINMLKLLKHMGFKLAVCSNAVRETVDAMLCATGYDIYMDLTLSNEDVVDPKPSPDIYLSAMQDLGVEPNSCMIVEDSEVGRLAAVTSGAHVLQADYKDVKIELFLGKGLFNLETNCRTSNGDSYNDRGTA